MDARGRPRPLGRHRAVGHQPTRPVVAVARGYGRGRSCSTRRAARLRPSPPRHRFLRRGGPHLARSRRAIREQTAGRRSLDDFCHKFHGGQNGLPSVKSYTLDEIVATLNELSPYDWKTHLESRTAPTSDKPPLSGVEHRSGWRLTYAKKPSEGQLAEEADNKLFDLSASIGLSIAEDGRIKDVVPGEPADRAGIARP